MPVLHYYDWTDDHLLSNDPEGNLVDLCDNCAQEYGDEVSVASDEVLDTWCEICNSYEDDE